jgi:Mrp family chromosome partitioning ATPase
MPGKQEDFQVETHPLNDIKRTIAVLSGKGGVGKSMITALLATYLQRTGRYRVGILDADVTGPSIPKLFGAEDFKPKGSDEGLFPVRTHSDIQLMSINLLLDNPTRR